MAQQFSLPGKVYLTGSGPGSASLLTLRALEVLRCADVVLHDDLVSEDVLFVIPPHAAVHSVGKRCGLRKVSQEQINQLMVTEARKGSFVVRLKGGDPLVFGRTQEEITALREAGITFEIIPGITAATAAAAAAQIPLTERLGASKLVFLSNHCCIGKAGIQIDKSLAHDSTLVFYMPGSDFADLANRLLQHGLSNELPCLLVSNIARKTQRLIRTNLQSLPLLSAQNSPSLLIVGATIATAQTDELFLQQDAASIESSYTEILPLEGLAGAHFLESKLVL